MLFTTATFICLFLPIVLAGFFGLARFSHAATALWLFVASVFFYGYWMPEFTLLLLGSIAGNFLVGSRISKLVDANVVHYGLFVTYFPHLIAAHASTISLKRCPRWTEIRTQVATTALKQQPIVTTFL